jgi:hypothetical protein
MRQATDKDTASHMPNPLPSLHRTPMVALRLRSTSPVYRSRAVLSWTSVLFLSFHSGVPIDWVESTVMGKHSPEQEQKPKWCQAKSH